MYDFFPMLNTFKYLLVLVLPNFGFFYLNKYLVLQIVLKTKVYMYIPTQDIYWNNKINKPVTYFRHSFVMFISVAIY